MQVKKDVSIEGCRPEILIAAITVIAPCFKSFGQEAVITSGTEKYKHSVKRSAHYRGDALDFRHRWFTPAECITVVGELQHALGENFVVVLEKTHIHIHYAPVYNP